MKLYIFDFDDTLAQSNSNVVVNHSDGSTTQLDSREFADYQAKDGDILDFSQFTEASGTIIWSVADIFRNAMQDPDCDTYIVTARGIGQPVKAFIEEELGLTGVRVAATNGSAGKIPWLENQLANKAYTEVVIFEDCRNNLRNLGNVINEFNLKKRGIDAYIKVTKNCVLPDQNIQVIEKLRRTIRDIILS